MPSFPFFSSKRKERIGWPIFSSASSSKSAYSSREPSLSPEPQPPTSPHFVRRGSEPAAPLSHGQRSRPPPVILYNPNGPSISGRASAPILTPRKSFDVLMPSLRQRSLTPNPVVSSPCVPSPPLPPYPAAASLSPPSRPPARAASFDSPRPNRAPPQARPRSRSFGIPSIAIAPPPVSPTSSTTPIASTPPPRPPRPVDLDLDLDLELCPSPVRRPSIGRKASLPRLDEVWLAFLEEAEETLDTISDLPDPRMYETRPSRRPAPLLRAVTEPPIRVLPFRPDEFLAERPSPFKPMSALPESMDSPPTPPQTPAYPRQRMPISPLDALDVSLSMSCALPSTQSKSSLASGQMPTAPSSLSIMSLDALNYSISLSAFPQPPSLDSVQEEGLDHEDADARDGPLEVSYLSHLPTPPVSPDSMVSISRTGTMRARASTPTLTVGPLAIPSFGKIMDASQGLEEVVYDEGESSSDESHFALGMFSPLSRHGIATRRQIERNDSFSSTSSSLSDMELEDVDEEDEECDCDSGCSSRVQMSHEVMSTPRRRSPSPRSSFEFDEPIRTPKDDELRVPKAGLHMELPPMPFVANMDIGPITPKVSDRSASSIHLGWSPAGTVEYGYAV